MKTIQYPIRQILALLALCLAIAVALGQAAQCQNTYPLCSPSITTLNGTSCDNGGTWHVGSPEPFYLYTCNNWWYLCGGTPGQGICNVMVRYSGTGRDIWCDGTGQHFFCLTGDLPCPLSEDHS